MRVAKQYGLSTGKLTLQPTYHHPWHSIYILVFVVGGREPSNERSLCSLASTRSSAPHMPVPLSCKEARVCCQAMSPLDQKADSPARTRPFSYTFLLLFMRCHTARRYGLSLKSINLPAR